MAAGNLLMLICSVTLAASSIKVYLTTRLPHVMMHLRGIVLVAVVAIQVSQIYMSSVGALSDKGMLLRECNYKRSISLLSFPIHCFLLFPVHDQ